MLENELNRRKEIIRYKAARKERYKIWYEENTTVKRLEMMTLVYDFISELRHTGIFILLNNTSMKVIDDYNIGLSPFKYILTLDNYYASIESSCQGYDQYYYKCESNKFPKYNTDCYSIEAVKDYLLTILAMLDPNIQKEKGIIYELPVVTKPSKANTERWDTTELSGSSAKSKDKTSSVNNKSNNPNAPLDRRSNVTSTHTMLNLWNTFWGRCELILPTIIKLLGF
jgi:hypothetical protein